MTNPEIPIRNPRHIALTTLKRTLDSDEIRVNVGHALDRADVDMAGGKVWSGPAATTFHKELAGRKKRLEVLYRQLVAEVEAELRRTPETTTSSNARYQRSGLK